MSVTSPGFPNNELGYPHERRTSPMDNDLAALDREDLMAEVTRLRAGIRAHRDSSAHELCWHHPQLWGLLPERIEPDIAVPLAEILSWMREVPGIARTA